VAISTGGTLPPFTVDQLGPLTVAHTLPSIHSHPWAMLARADQSLPPSPWRSRLVVATWAPALAVAPATDLWPLAFWVLVDSFFSLDRSFVCGRGRLWLRS
jgi:hypothetical protein